MKVIRRRYQSCFSVNQTLPNITVHEKENVRGIFATIQKRIALILNIVIYTELCAALAVTVASTVIRI